MTKSFEYKLRILPNTHLLVTSQMPVHGARFFFFLFAVLFHACFSVGQPCPLFYIYGGYLVIYYLWIIFKLFRGQNTAAIHHYQMCEFIDREIFPQIVRFYFLACRIAEPLFICFSTLPPAWYITIFARAAIELYFYYRAE